jgi:hypothetical protein
MGYYDFDDHFWSPREVCAQVPKKDTQDRFFKVHKLLHPIFRKVFLQPR